MAVDVKHNSDLDVVKYREAYSSPDLLDNHRRRADKITAVCANYSFRPLEVLSCLDLGISDSMMLEQYARHFRDVYSISGNPDITAALKKSANQSNLNLVCAGADQLPIPDNSIDVVICNQIHNQFENQWSLFEEVYRVLRYDGFCYFSARNYRKFFSLSKVKSLTRNFWRHDYTALIYAHPESFHATESIPIGNIYSRLSTRMFSFVYPYLGSWVWVLTKRK